MRSVHPLLQKLLDDAPSSEVEAAVVTCVKQVESLPPVERPDAVADLQQLLELRGVLDKLRRRSRELRALYATAGDLSSMREIEDVLQAIVRRGRQLLDSDIAYLMLVDENRRDTYMRVTEGTTRKGFEDIRLPLGVGLGGQVAHQCAPMWTRNYLADERHAHIIEEIVNDEDVVAVLGVPLCVGSKVVGVLFAADRSERDYSTEEVSLLASLADHAAIAIENASRFQETRSALTALASANAQIEQTNTRLQRAIDLHERLMKLVIGGGEPQDLANVLCDVVSGSVVIWDDRQQELGRAIAHEANDIVVTECLSRFAPSDLADGTQRHQLESGEAVLTPIVAANDRLGSLIYLGDPVDDDDFRSLERGAASIALLLLNRRARDEADNQLRGEILAELLSRSPRDATNVRRRASLIDVDLTLPMNILVLVPAGGVTRTLQVDAAELVRDAGGLVTSYPDRVVALIPQYWAGEPAHEAAHRLQHLNVTVGAAGPTNELSELAALEERAHRSAKLLIALGRAGQGATSDELGVFGLLLSDAGEEQIHSFVENRLQPVRAYDDERGTALMSTMEAYFAHEGNVGQTADALFNHPNTIYQRLERLDRLLGEGWRSGDQSLEVRLALRLDRLVRQLD